MEPICGNCAPGANGTNNAEEYNWQAMKTSVRERFAFLFNNEILADVHFIVGENESLKRIPAHRLVLSAGSRVFYAMFNGALASTQNEITLPDMEPTAFLALLKCLYSDEVEIGPETVLTALYTAKKYIVPTLEKACVDFLNKSVCDKNAFLLLTQSRLYDEQELADVCLQIIDKNTQSALSADEFTDVDLATLMVVLKRDTLHITEAQLFLAVQRWAEAECRRQKIAPIGENLRAVLGGALSLVRFPLMSNAEFASGAAQCGILTDREIVDVFLNLSLNPKPTIGAGDTPRRYALTNTERTLNRFTETDGNWNYRGPSDCIRFMTNRKVSIVGFGLYGSNQVIAKYQVLIELLEYETSGSARVFASNMTNFTCVRSNKTYRVMFKKAVEIQPNVHYTARATLKGPSSRYGTKGLREVKVGMTKFTFESTGCKDNGTTVEEGQIPEIIFRAY